MDSVLAVIEQLHLEEGLDLVEVLKLDLRHHTRLLKVVRRPFMFDLGGNIKCAGVHVRQRWHAFRR